MCNSTRKMVPAEKEEGDAILRASAESLVKKEKLFGVFHEYRRRGIRGS